MLPTIVVGVDPQTGSEKGTGTGIAVFENLSETLGQPNWHLLQMYLAKPSKYTDNMHDRIGSMAHGINEFFKASERYPGKEVHVIVEDAIPIIRYQRAACALSKMIGAIQAVISLPKREWTYEEVSIRDWRKNCGVGTGRGWDRKRCKAAVTQWFNAQFKITHPNIDCIEAAGIGWYRVSRLIQEEKKACGT